MTPQARFLATCAALLLLSVALARLPNASSRTADVATSGGAWGESVLWAEPGLAARLSPIPLANACAIKASSCARCHNGERAAAPPSTPQTGPWHRDHSNVTDSCVGCHRGNARVLKQEIAHHKLVAEPLTPTPQCASCHAGAELTALAAPYRAALAAPAPTPNP